MNMNVRRTRGLIASVAWLVLAVSSVAAAAGHAAPATTEPVRAARSVAVRSTPSPETASKGAPAPKVEAGVEATARSAAPASIKIPSSAGLTQTLPDGIALAKLNAVQKEVAAQAASGKKPWVIMDVDDTLVHTVTYPRNSAIDGAVAYAKSLAKAGGTIVYVTGRKDTPGEHAKTLATLEHLGFPLGKQGDVELNGMKVPTVIYKKAETNDLVKKLGEPVAAFDNEIANARMFRSDLPSKVSVFRLATTSFSKDTGGKGDILVIKNFAPKAEPAGATVKTPASP
jgi:hypothetical protein